VIDAPITAQQRALLRQLQKVIVLIVVMYCDRMLVILTADEACLIINIHRDYG
jgi:hypothetical protein